MGAQASLRVEQALRLLPDVDGMAPLRAVVVSLSSARGPEAWTAAEPNRTIGKRALDPTELRARVPQVIARVTGRVGELYAAAVDALESERNGEFSQAVRALVRAGYCEEQDHRWAEAEAWYQQALRTAEQLRDREPEIETLCHLGRLQAARGYLEEGARAYQRALALAEAEADAERAATACRGLGEVLGAQGQWAGAEAWYARGLQHALASRPLAAAMWLGLGEAARHRGQWATAAERLERALTLFEALGDVHGIVRALLARSALEAAQGRGADVIATCREALGRLPVGDFDPELEGSVRLRLAEVYLEAGRLPDAEDEARRAEEVAITRHQPRLLAQVYVLMGRLRNRQSDENGFVFFEQAIELCRTGQRDRRLEADVYRDYAAFRLTMGSDRQEARAYLLRARDLLEPFGDRAASARVDAELGRLDAGVPNDSSSFRSR